MDSLRIVLGEAYKFNATAHEMASECTYKGRRPDARCRVRDLTNAKLSLTGPTLRATDWLEISPRSAVSGTYAE